MRWLFRVVVAVHLAALFAQPVLAGRFMSGDYDLLAVHRANATAVTVIGFVQLAVAVLVWRLAGGPGWRALVCVGVSAAESLQIYLGFNRIIGVHVPLGVAIIALSAVLAVSVWRPAVPA